MAPKTIDVNDELSTKIREMYLSGMRVYEIRNALNGEMLDDGIVKRLKRMHLYKKRVKRVNYDMNKLLHLHENPNGCYLLGLLLADGSMSVTKESDSGVKFKKIGLEINRKDEDSLIKIRDYFIQDAELYYRKDRPLVSLTFCNTDFCEYLENIGININKRAVEMPDLPENIMNDRKLGMAFLAGYFDGDGCISVVPCRKRGSNVINIKYNITAATPVWDKLHKLVDKLGFIYHTNNYATFASTALTDLCNSTKLLMEMYTSTDLVYIRRKEKLKEACRAILDSPIRSKSYGWDIVRADKTGYFTGGNL